MIRFQCEAEPVDIMATMQEGGGESADRDRNWSSELARAADWRECCFGVRTRKDLIMGENICSEGFEWALNAAKGSK